MNRLPGYTRDMDITAMRDTIIPLGKDGSLKIDIEADGAQVDSIRYEVYSLDGKDQFAQGRSGCPGGRRNRDDAQYRQHPVGNGAGSSAESDTDDGRQTGGLLYADRFPGRYHHGRMFSFAQKFHTDALNKKNSEELESYLEPGDESDNTTFQTVNIHSNINHIQWGGLSPEVTGDVEWSIKESNTVYTSILANYQVSCRDEDGGASLYNIREFFRVRSLKGTIYLLDYNRDMEKVFRGIPRISARMASCSVLLRTRSRM